MNKRIPAIPTKFRGINFRSRLEARWGAFFSLMGWDWSYEPIDLDGYIPDFILHMHEDVLVEVKPFMRLNDPSIKDAIAKIEGSGWDPKYDGIWPDRPAIVVGAVLFHHSYTNYNKSTTWHEVVIGSQAFHCEAELAILSECEPCCGISIRSQEASYSCMKCGRKKASSHLHRRNVQIVDTCWNEAGNQVQWMGRDS